MAGAHELEPILEALRQARNEGNPVAEPSHDYARVALRRWSSSAHRGLDPVDREGRIRDLAKGLIAHFERDPKLVGPLKVDYEYVARVIANGLDPVATRPQEE
jgi:hypothetical protein